MVGTSCSRNLGFIKSLSQDEISALQAALIQSLFLDTTILLPIHIVLMELIVHPVSAFVFDEPQGAAVERKKEFIGRRSVVWSSLRGILLTGLSLATFFFTPGTPDLRRSLAVLILVTGNIGLLIAETGGISQALLSFSAFRRTWMASLLLLFLAFALAYIPAISTLFCKISSERLTPSSVID